MTLFGWWNTLTKAEAEATFAPIMNWQDVNVVFDPNGNPTYFKQYAKNPQTGKAYLTDAFIEDKNARRANPGDPLNWYWVYETGHNVPMHSWDKVADWVTEIFRLGLGSIRLDGTKALGEKFVWTNNTSINPNFYSSLAMVYSPMKIVPNLHPSLDPKLWPNECKNAETLNSCIDPTLEMMLGSQCMQASLKSYFPGSGSYMNENNPFDEDWRQQHWGVNYPALLKVKHQYDPSGLFVCHHCVGSDQYVFTEDSRGYCLAEGGAVCPFFHGEELGSGALPVLPPPKDAPVTWQQCQAYQKPCRLCRDAEPCFTDAACAVESYGIWKDPYSACNIGARECAPCFKNRKCLLKRTSYSSHNCDYLGDACAEGGIDSWKFDLTFSESIPECASKLMRLSRVRSESCVWSLLHAILLEHARTG